MTTTTLAAEHAPHETYRALLAERRLGYQQCRGCAHVVFPPRSRCPQCGADALGWQDSRGAGTVYAVTEISSRQAPAYAVVLVDLDEGFRMMSRVDDVTACPVEIGDRVRVDFVAVRDVLEPFVVRVGDRA